MNVFLLTKMSKIARDVVQSLDKENSYSAEDIAHALCNADICDVLTGRGYTQEDIERTYQEIENLAPVKIDRGDFLLLENESQANYLNKIALYVTNQAIIGTVWEDNGGYFRYYEIENQDDEIVDAMDFLDYADELNNSKFFKGKIFND